MREEVLRRLRERDEGPDVVFRLWGLGFGGRHGG
jgi:hypothetical protein